MALNWEDSGLLASGSEPGKQLIVRRRWLYKLVLRRWRGGEKEGEKERGREEGRGRKAEREGEICIHQSIPLKGSLFVFHLDLFSPLSLIVFTLMCFTWLLDCSLLEDKYCRTQLCISYSAWRTLVLKNLAVECMNKRMNFCVWSISFPRKKSQAVSQWAQYCPLGGVLKFCRGSFCFVVFLLGPEYWHSKKHILFVLMLL